jgi:hypothetical protein
MGLPELQDPGAILSRRHPYVDCGLSPGQPAGGRGQTLAATASPASR